MKLRAIVDYLYIYLPSHFRYDIVFVESFDEMCRRIYQQYPSYFRNLKAVKKYYMTAIQDGCNRGNKSYFTNNEIPAYLKTHRTRHTGLPLAVAATPILFNRNIRIYNPNAVVFAILHEIGHNIMYIYNENLCDRFALEWCEKLKRRGFFKRLGRRLS